MFIEVVHTSESSITIQRWAVKFFQCYLQATLTLPIYIQIIKFNLSLSLWGMSEHSACIIESVSANKELSCLLVVSHYCLNIQHINGG